MRRLVWEFVAAVIAVFVGVILVILLIGLVQGENITHSGLNARLQIVERNQAQIICLLNAGTVDEVTIAQCAAVEPLG